MLLNNKLKNFCNTPILNSNYPLKLTKFKSLKWKKYNLQLNNKNKKKIKYSKFIYIFNKKKKRKLKYKKNNFIINPLILVTKLYRLKKRIKYLKYKNINIKKLSLYYSREKIIKNNFKFSKINNLLRYLIKPLYSINVLLWLLNISISKKNIKQKICSQKIKLNNKDLKNINLLKKGDLVNFNWVYDKNSSLLKFAKNNNIISFIECDLYVNNIIILKNLYEIKLNDLYLQLSDYFNVSLILRHK